MKVICLIISICVLIACGGYSAKAHSSDNLTAHIENYYIAENGMVLNFKNADYPQYLSESLGLYMQFLLGMKDEIRFQQQVDILLEHFLQPVGDHLFVKWELGEQTTVGALIDDLRIAWVLKHAAAIFEDNELYSELSDRIMATIKDTMIVNGRLVDFFDWHYNIAKDQLFLSYYIVPAMSGFPDYTFVPLESLTADPFFMELYIDGEFHPAGDEVNMIDQSLIAIAYFERTGTPEPNFQQFISGRLQEDGLIFARYNRDTLEKSNENQSSAAYAFLLHYFELTNQFDYAATVRDLLLAIETYDPETTHFFDFINKEMALRGFLNIYHNMNAM